MEVDVVCKSWSRTCSTVLSSLMSQEVVATREAFEFVAVRKVAEEGVFV
jgi:hypothetical protein